MTHDQLFLRALDDLRQCNPQDEYSMLRASALLRQLLLEQLVDVVNRERGLRLTFRIRNAAADKLAALVAGAGVSSCASVDPQGETGSSIIEVGRDKFLGMRTVVVEGDEYTVRGIIKLFANVQGGVHVGTAAEIEEHRKVRALNDFLHIFGAGSVSYMLHGIIQVTLAGLAPLEVAIRTPEPRRG